MSSRPLVVVEVRLQNASQTGLILDEHVIKHSRRIEPDPSLNVGVPPGRLRCSEKLTAAQAAGCLVKFLYVAPIPIAQQIMRGAVSGKSWEFYTFESRSAPLFSLPSPAVLVSGASTQAGETSATLRATWLK